MLQSTVPNFDHALIAYYVHMYVHTRSHLSIRQTTPLSKTREAARPEQGGRCRMLRQMGIDVFPPPFKFLLSRGFAVSRVL